MPARFRIRKDCANCSHHISAHRYIINDEAKLGPQNCGIPNCQCVVYRRPNKFERVKRGNHGT